MIGISVVRAVTMGGYLLADGIVGLTVVASLMSAAQQGSSGARTALVVGLSRPAERLDALASLRVLSHAGDALGAAAGALVIQLDTRAGYTRADRRQRRQLPGLRARRRAAPARPCHAAANADGSRGSPRCATARTSPSPRSAAC